MDEPVANAHIARRLSIIERIAHVLFARCTHQARQLPELEWSSALRRTIREHRPLDINEIGRVGRNARTNRVARDTVCHHLSIGDNRGQRHALIYDRTTHAFRAIPDPHGVEGNQQPKCNRNL